jgi:hypothetical protein
MIRKSRGSFLNNQDDFMPLWNRANACLQTLSSARPAEPALYFDSIDISTSTFFFFIRSLLEFEGADTFAVLALRPDPFGYFYHHFKKYPAFIVRPEHDVDDYFAFLNADPGDSPADALANNAQRYAILPTGGSWFVYGNWSKEMSVLSGPSKLVEFGHRNYPFFLDPGPEFRIAD